MVIGWFYRRLYMVMDGYRWVYIVIGGYTWLCYSYTTSCCGLSGIHEAVIQLEAEAQPRLLIIDSTYTQYMPIQKNLSKSQKRYTYS